MATPVIMPKQGQSVESCLITKWFKNVGEKVKKGEVLFSHETDKASFDEEAPCDGVLLAIFFEADDEVPCLANVAVIGEEGEDVEEFRPKTEEKKETRAQAEEKPREAEARPAPVVKTGGGAVSPRARKKARELGVLTDGLGGSGPGGRVIERDVEREAGEGRLTPLAVEVAGTGIGGRVRARDLESSGEGTTEKLSNIRKVIARQMSESLHNTAQLTLHASANAVRLLELRKRFQAELADGKRQENVTINDMVCLAVVRTLKAHPALNAHFLGDAIKTLDNVNLGLAVDTERGLMVPTLMEADRMSVEQISTGIRELAEGCRAGNISPDLLRGASFTVTNLGSFGIEMFTPVLNPPQVGILGVNAITPRDTVPRIGLSLTFDHRALDGAPAAAFLKSLTGEIEELEV